MSTNDIQSSCANCGKGEEESVVLKNCVACKMVKYCNRDCQKAHRSQHKKECRKRAAEMHDEALFRQPPQKEDCPICFMRMPSLHTGRRYMSCCGKTICSGCIRAGARVGDDELCPFCRAPATSAEDIVERNMKRVGVGDAESIYDLGCDYSEGKYGLPQDHVKALELWHQAGELGHAGAYGNVGNAYFDGEGVERDEKKAKHYWELAAMGGDECARHNLGTVEAYSGNMDKAFKHYMIAVGGGHNNSLKPIKKLFLDGHATKDDYAKALIDYQAYLEDIKSKDRDKAAKCDEMCKYYE